MIHAIKKANQERSIRTLILGYIVVSLIMFVSGHAEAQPNLVLIVSPPGESVGLGQTYYTSNETDISVAGNAETVEVMALGFRIYFDAPDNLALAVGEHTNVGSYPINGDSSGILISANARSCRGDGCGQFHILEIATDSEGQVVRFWATFSVKCSCIGWGGPITGDIRYHSLLAPDAPASRILRVPQDFPSIQSALDDADIFAVDTVLVSPGTYEEAIDFLGKRVQVVSLGGPANTYIVAPPQSTTVSLTGEPAPATLAGFTIISTGIGISISGSSTVMIISNTILSCGAGITSESRSLVVRGSPTIRGNTISNCYVAIRLMFTGEPLIDGNLLEANGAGISMASAGSPMIRNNTIRDNLGHGIDMFGYSDPQIIQNLVVGNTGNGVSWVVPGGGRGPRVINNTIIATGDGAAVSAGSYAESQVVNNILVGNPAFVGGAFDPINPPIQFNDVYSPIGIAFAGGITGLVGIAGNISSDPMFVCPTAGDFRLRQNSPCVDAGTNSDLLLPVDFNFNPRVVTGHAGGPPVVDIGAFEFDPSTGSGVPILNCTNVCLVADKGLCGATSSRVPAPSIGNNCGGMTTLMNNAHSMLPVGTNTITWIATDNYGNSASCQQTVNVVESISVAFLPPASPKPDANLIRVGQVVPHRIQLLDCHGRLVTSGVTVKLNVQGIELTPNGENIFQDLTAAAVTKGNWDAGGALVPHANYWQFNLSTDNFSDRNTLANPSRFYRSTVTVFDGGTGCEIGGNHLILETRRVQSRHG